MKRIVIIALMSVFAMLGVLPANAQIDDMYRDYREVYRDTILVTDKKEVTVSGDKYTDPYQVVSNPLRQNWFVFATGGAHTFMGDYSGYGPFSGTLSPDYSLGFGKWFMPWLGVKLEFIHSNSRGYTAYPTAHYGYGDWIQPDNGKPGYRRMKTSWMDFGGSAIFNLTRLWGGYEGNNSRENMGQWLLATGLGAVHHLGYNHSYGSDNELSAHLELQYSRFFTPRKNLSLDFKARGLFYQTNFDLEYGQADYAARHVDMNLGLNIGLTWYLGKKGSNGWRNSGSTVYRNEYRETKIPILKVKETEVIKEKTVSSGIITFYVFFPNNYSGRDDAPIVESSEVNAIDYLAGGIYTQKRFADSDAAARQLEEGRFPGKLKAVDVPTETANRDLAMYGVPRGYEMEKERPMSLSLDPRDLAAFGDSAGFYYAPINDGSHLWKYRIDNATHGQNLVSNENYEETATFGLNSHQGLNTVRSFMEVNANDELISFADMYAALTSNEGFISNYTDAATVEKVRDILDRGVILLLQADGLATSQDNYSGKDAVRVGLERNSALAENRTNTILKWLMADPSMQDVRSQSFIFSNRGEISKVEDASVRGLNAKLNRCVRVRIRYMIK